MGLRKHRRLKRKLRTLEIELSWLEIETRLRRQALDQVDDWMDKIRSQVPEGASPTKADVDFDARFRVEWRP